MSHPPAGSDKDKSKSTPVETPNTASYNQNANGSGQFQPNNYMYHGIGMNGGVGMNADGSQWSMFGKLPDGSGQAGIVQDNYDQDEANFVQSFAVQQQPFLSYPYLGGYQPFGNQLYPYGYSFGQPYGDVHQFMGIDGQPFFALPDGYGGNSNGEMNADGQQRATGDLGQQPHLFPQLYHVGNALANLSLQDIQNQQLLQQQLYHQHLLQLQQQQQQLQQQLLQTSQQLALHTEQLGIDEQVAQGEISEHVAQEQQQNNHDELQHVTEPKSQKIEDKPNVPHDREQVHKLEMADQSTQNGQATTSAKETQPIPQQDVQSTPPASQSQQKPKQEGPRSWADIASKQASATPSNTTTTTTTTITATASTASVEATPPATSTSTSISTPTTPTPVTATTSTNSVNVNPAQVSAGAVVPVKRSATIGTVSAKPDTKVHPKVPDKFNPTHFDYNVPSARFFVIKSYSEDDIHKSIKYGVWASTDSGNRRLDAAYKESSMRGPIYLFFSVNASGQFCGMARMTSALDYGKKCELWAQDKWNGQFSVTWIFIKDIPNGHMRHIRLVNNENKPVTNSRDTQEIFLEPGREMLRIFTTFNSKTSILDDFNFYDKRQELMKEKKGQLEDTTDEPKADSSELLPIATGESRKQRGQPPLQLTNSSGKTTALLTYPNSNGTAKAAPKGKK